LRYADKYASSQVSYLVALFVLFWMGILIYLVFFSLIWDARQIYFTFKASTRD